jgi:hypothetical protein
MRPISIGWKVVFVFVILVILLPLFAYWLKFGSFGLSGDFKAWVDFSTYMSPYLVAALTIILAYISWQSLELMKLKEKPLIVIEKKPKKEGSDEFLSFRNIGNGPALEVKLFVKVERNDNIQNDPFLVTHGINTDIEEIERRSFFHYMVSAFSLSQEESIFIDWQKSVEKISVVYSDIYNRKTSLVWTEGESTYFGNDQVGVDSNGLKGREVIFRKDKSANKKHDQVFSLAEVGKKTYDFAV